MMLALLGGLEVLFLFLFGGLISLICFALWIGVTTLLNRCSAAQNRAGAADPGHLRMLSAAGLV